MHIRTIYPPDLNFTAGLLYISTADSAESNAFSKLIRTFLGTPLDISNIIFAPSSPKAKTVFLLILYPLVS